ncbi:MAG: hypothetical protein MZV70_18395 [Desulfobacterales bacterium]|nr:hypothetical protein [Desulfobacterales bacterium]
MAETSLTVEILPDGIKVRAQVRRGPGRGARPGRHSVEPVLPRAGRLRQVRGPDPRRPPPLPRRRRSVASRGARARPRPPARLPVRPAQRRRRGDAAGLPAREGRRPRYGAPRGRLRRPGRQEAPARPGEALPLRPDRRGRSTPGPARIARPDPAAGRALKARRFDASAPPGPSPAVIYDDLELLDLEPDEAGRDIFGLAVDLGTTTVAAELVDLRTGKIADRASAVNAQTSYGADVVSRITFAFENPDNLRRLRTAAVQQLNDMVGTMSRRSGVPRHRIYDAVVAGNTAMNHILCGVPVDSMALAPFHAVFSILPPQAASEIGLGPPSPGPGLHRAQHQELRRRGRHGRSRGLGIRRRAGDGAVHRPGHERGDRAQEGRRVRDDVDRGRPGLRRHEHQLRHAGPARGHQPGRVGQRIQVPDGRRPAAPGRPAERASSTSWPGPWPAASWAATAASSGRRSACG